MGIESIQILSDRIDNMGVYALAYHSREALANYLKRHKMPQRFASNNSAFVDNWDAEVVVRYTDGTAIGF